MLIACPSCQRQLNVPDNAAGKQVRCPAPDCGTVFYVPAAPAPAPVPAVPQMHAPPPAPAAPPAPARPVAAPRPAAAAAPPSPAAAPAPFDFGTSGPAGPAADFGFTDKTDGGLKGIGLRTRISRATGWLNLAAGTMVLFAIFSIGLQVASAVMAGMRAVWPMLVGAGCTPFVLLPFPIVIVIGARMLAGGRRFGLAMTAAIMSIVVGGIALLVTLITGGLSAFVGYVAVSHGMHEGQRILLIGECGISVISALVTFCALYGGFVAMRTLMNPEVKKTFT
jgi:hypothetical protein